MTVSITEDRARIAQELAAGEPGLRGRTPRVARLLAVIEERMTRRQRAWTADHVLAVDPALRSEPLVVRRARAFEKTLLEMPIAIEPDDLIVGNSVDAGVIIRTGLAKYATEEDERHAAAAGAKVAATLSHKTPFYYDALEQGLAGVVARIDATLAEIEARPDSAERAEKVALFRAMRIECLAVIALAERYADLADSLNDGSVAPERAAELGAIAATCRRVPEHPARSFREAVQCFWLIHYAFFSTGTSLSCGRIDQYLYPYLRRDLERGAITLAEAQEIVDCLWLRFNDRAQIIRQNFFDDDSGNGTRQWAAGHRTRTAYAEDAADAINHFGQNILLSGIRPDGGDGTNELTYMCLNSLEKFAFTSPVVTVRLHRQSPPEFVTRVAEVVKTGGGMPYVNNDDVLVPAYADLGVPLPDARGYANSNCWETMIEGKSDQELIRGMNFLLCLELALNRGRSRVHGRMGPDTGDPRGFDSFDRVMEAWKAQLDYQLRQGIDYIGDGVASGALEHSGHGRYSYNPLLSALTRDCIANEQDVIRGGARYTIWHVMGEAVANAIDAMAAIKKLVYDDRSLDMERLLDALDADWENYEDLRRRLAARAPRFANDDDFADDIGREMTRFFVERTRFHAARHPGVIFPPSVGTFSWYVMIGKEVGPTPDGRRAFEPVAANFSPAPGADMSGPTAAINSYLKMPVAPMASGAPLDLRFSASHLKGVAGTQRLAGLIKTFVDMGGNMLTLTVTDVEELKRAMKAPEKYRHLRVRMGGWSAYFVMLSQAQQRLHIERVEHGLA